MRLLPLVLLTPLAVAAAACGGGGSSVDPVAKAATASAQAKAEHMHLQGTVSANGTPVRMTGDGDFANDPLLGTFTVSTSFGGRSISLDEVMKGSRVYLSSSAFAGQIPGNKKWMSVDLAQAGKAAGVSLLTSASQSPTDALKQLEAAGRAKKVGDATIAGVHTTEYRATVDPAKAAKLSGHLGRKVTYRPVEAWIGDDGRIRKEHLAYTIGANGATPASDTDLTLTFTNYGETVHVSVPPATDTYDATALATQSAGKNGGTP